MIVVGIQGPSAAVPKFPPAPPFPPWFVYARPSAVLVGIEGWLAVLLGGAGLALALVAARRGWRPQPRRLVLCSIAAVIALMVIPPVGSGDMLLYVVSGRIAVLGRSPYVMTPEQLRSSGDPVGVEAVSAYPNEPTRYGPVATLTEAAASELAGESVASTIFWLKMWNGLAYLALVLALDRLARSEPARRVRVHLLWSVNPLMLLVVMAGGHNDGLAAGVGATALFALRRVDSRRAFLAGVLMGLASAIKVQFALYGAGLAWVARRSPRALVAMAFGGAAILVPGYLLAGRDAISASMSVVGYMPSDYTPWFAVIRVLAWQHASATIDTVGLAGSVALAVILLWRMPSGSREFPAVRVALAVALAWLIVSPQQRSWYFAMIFPLLAMVPASRLDWIVMFDATAAAVTNAPRLVYAAGLRPAWLSAIVRTGYSGIIPLALAIAGVVLLWLCFTNDWRSVASLDNPSFETARQKLDTGTA